MQIVRIPILKEGHPQGPHPRQAQPAVLHHRPQQLGRGCATGAKFA